MKLRIVALEFTLLSSKLILHVSCFLSLVCLHLVTQVGSRRICLVPDVVPPLAGFLLLAVLGSVASVLYAFLKLLTVFDISPGSMFQASTTLFEKKL